MVNHTTRQAPVLAQKLGAIWGVMGVMLLLGFAVYRLTPFMTELLQEKLSAWQLLVLIVWCVIMVFFEGYRAFGQQFSPRVVARAQYIYRHATWTQVLLAPLFCIGYFGAPKKRIISSVALMTGIIALIIAVHFVAQPWRGIIDSGVVLGLACGLLYIAAYTIMAIRQVEYISDPET